MEFADLMYLLPITLEPATTPLQQISPTTFLALPIIKAQPRLLFPSYAQ
jgi:hypothetical protein